uniref:DUF4283 domain-containing protein n=1 Tax=Quercus lobata TaxID=97700 RepID=A0A7N2RF29_QUELO
MSLNDREGGSVCLTEEKSGTEVILAAKFLTKRVLNVDAIVKTFTPLWRSVNGFQVRSAGDHILLFVFDDKEDVERILANEPWSFDKHLVAGGVATL